MDGNRFDDLSRALAQRRTRRGVLKGLVGGLAAGIAALAGRSTAEAQLDLRLDALVCLGLTPKLAAQVCVALNLPHVARTGCVNGRCAILACQPGWANCDGQVQTGCETPLGTRDNCGACGDGCARLDDVCTVGACAGGSCVAQPANEGGICDDGNACTQTDTCQAGVCTGSNPVVCQPLDQCHVAGVCDPLTGACSNPNAPDGTTCNDDNACTDGDTCQNGVCEGGTAVVCTTDNPCLTAACDPDAGCTTTPKAAGESCDADNNACTVGDACDGAGTCVPGQQRTCDPCLRCNQADGTCEPDPDQVGDACPGDGNLCFGAFQCTTGGACMGVQPVVCTPSDQCHVAGTCDPSTGRCSNPDAPDDTPCNDNDACTQTDTCQAGVCTGENPVVCPTPDQCHTQGTCDPATGTCSNPVAPVGTACDDQDPCTENDACLADGTCAGTPKVCTDNNVCTADTCNPTTGACDFTPVPNNTVPCPTDSGAPGRCTDGRCCVATQSVCNVTADCCLGTNVCVNGRCLPSPQCNRTLGRERATRGGGTAGTSQCQRTPDTCEQTLNVTLTGAVPNTTFRAIIDQGSAGQPTSHIDVGFFTTDASGNATFTGTITVPGTCPTVVDNEIVLATGAFDQHQYIQTSFQPCRFCTT